MVQEERGSLGEARGKHSKPEQEHDKRKGRRGVTRPRRLRRAVEAADSGCSRVPWGYVTMWSTRSLGAGRAEGCDWPVFISFMLTAGGGRRACAGRWGRPKMRADAEDAALSACTGEATVSTAGSYMSLVSLEQQ